MSNLREQVLSIVKQIECGVDCEGKEVDAFTYMEDALDINYVLNSDRTYKGARILVAFGGPNIWIDTVSQYVEGYWWDEKVELRYTEDSIGLDDCCGEIYSC